MSEKSKEAKIVYGRIPAVRIYEINESELKSFETGSPFLSSLNLAIFFLTLGFSFLTTIFTTDIKSQFSAVIFISIMLVGFVLGGFFFVVWGKTYTSIKKLVKEIRERAETAEMMEETIAAEPEERIIFADDFDTDEGWQQYKNGTVSLSQEFVRTGVNSLKKDKNSEPNGGYKIIPEVHSDIVLDGWIYRPSGYHGGEADRLALENEDFNGYGFIVSHKAKRFGIERRDVRKAELLAVANHNLPTDAWYRFEFRVKEGSWFDLFLYNHSGQFLVGITDVRDKKYNSFNRVCIHGGFEYYIDQLRLQRFV